MRNLCYSCLKNHNSENMKYIREVGKSCTKSFKKRSGNNVIFTKNAIA